MLDQRTALRLDALASGALGALLVVLAGVLVGPLGLPVPLSIVVGAGLLAWAAFVAWVSIGVAPTLVTDVILLNTAWVLASVGYALLADLTALGVAFVLVQAAAVAALTAMQAAGRRAARAAQPA